MSLLEHCVLMFVGVWTYNLLEPRIFRSVGGRLSRWASKTVKTVYAKWLRLCVSYWYIKCDGWVQEEESVPVSVVFRSVRSRSFFGPSDLFVCLFVVHILFYGGETFLWSGVVGGAYEGVPNDGFFKSRVPWRGVFRVGVPWMRRWVPRILWSIMVLMTV